MGDGIRLEAGRSKDFGVRLPILPLTDEEIEEINERPTKTSACA